MGKTKNRTERMKKEMEEKDGEIVQLKTQLQQLKDENQSLRLSLHQLHPGVAGVSALSGKNPFTGVFSRAAPSSTALPSSSSSSSLVAGDALPLGGPTLSHSRIRSIFSFTDLTCFSDTAPMFGSSNPFSSTPFIFGSSHPFSDISSIIGLSKPFPGSGMFLFGPSPTLESETIVSAPVLREPRRFRRVNRERKVVGEKSTDQVPSSRNEESFKDEPTFERMVLEEMVLPGSVLIVDEEHSEFDHVNDEKVVHSKVVVPDANATCDEEIVASDFDCEIAEHKLVEGICNWNGEVEAVEKEECSIGINGTENVLMNFVEEVEKPSNVPKNRIIPETSNAKNEAFNVDEIGKAWCVEEEEMSNDQLNRILRLSEALNEKIDEELEKINNCNTKLVKKEEVDELMERVRKNEESVNAMLVDKEANLDEMKRIVTELEQDEASHRNQIHHLRQEANEQLRIKEEMERKLETTQGDYKAILREREEVDDQLVEMLTVINELQDQNLSQRDEIHRLQKGANTQRRRKLWPKVTSFFVVAATSVAFLLCRL